MRLLGTDALFLAALVTARRQEEDAKWRALSASTDFDGLPDFAEIPIARILTEANSDPTMVGSASSSGALYDS